MKKGNANHEHLKDFCLAILIFYGVVVFSSLATAICWYLPDRIFYYLYDMLAHLSVFLCFLGGALSVIWLIVFVIWCYVICKKEGSKKVLRTPIVAISLLSTIVYIIYAAFTILSGF